MIIITLCLFAFFVVIVVTARVYLRNLSRVDGNEQKTLRKNEKIILFISLMPFLFIIMVSEYSVERYRKKILNAIKYGNAITIDNVIEIPLTNKFKNNIELYRSKRRSGSSPKCKEQFEIKINDLAMILCPDSRSKFLFWLPKEIILIGGEGHIFLESKELALILSNAANESKGLY